MQTRLRYLAPITFVLLAGCSDNNLGVGAIDAASNIGTGGAPSGSGGAGSGGLTTSGTGGSSGPSSSGTGGAATGTGGAASGTGGVGGAVSGPCGAATCLASLFQTCVPEGACAVHAGNSPSAVFSDVCYSNGVTVLNVGSYSGANTTGSLSVSRDGALCYRVDTSIPPNSGPVSYVVTDGNGNEIATGVTVDKSGSVVVTCKGGSPTTVDGSCLQPVSDSPTCDLQTCPTSGSGGSDGGTGGYDGGMGVGDAIQDKPTPDAPALDADAGSQSCGDAACGPGQACALVMGGTAPQCFPPTDAGACSDGFVLVSSCRVGGGSTYYQPGCTEPQPTPRCYDLPDACGDFCSCLCPSGGGTGCYPGPGYYLCGYP